MSNEIKAVASAVIMPGTSGFTMACFSAADVPDGTDVYDQSAIDRLTAERDAAVADAERLRELLRVTASVAIVQLFDAAPADVEAQFSMDELQQVVEVTSPLRDLGVSVESQYRIAIDAARKEA